MSDKNMKTIDEPWPNKPLLIYHISILPNKSGPLVKTVFINYPTRDDLINFCTELPEIAVLIKSVNWPEEPGINQSKVRVEAKSLGRSLGYIECEREAIINNPGRCNIEIRQ